MRESFGPWATALGAELRLSTFWRRRLGRLASARSSAAVLSRRDCLRLGVVGAGALALPGLRRAGAVPPPERPGRIFVTARTIGARGTPSALIAVDPKEGTWTEVLDKPVNRPRVSPDGKTIAYIHEGALWTRDLDGANEPKRLMEIIDPGGDPPVWSGDGKRLIISAGALGNEDESGNNRWRFKTYRVDADGSNKVELGIPEFDGVHDWSPDGRWVVTVSGRHKEFAWQLYLMTPDGKDQRRLTDGDNTFGARFSPDGRRVLYGSGGETPASRRGVWVVDLDGKNRRRLFPTAGPETADACWSPDGKRIAIVGYNVVDENAGRLVVMDLDGGNRAEFPLEQLVHTDMPDWR
jgi:Tol biopolymer transport system component